MSESNLLACVGVGEREGVMEGVGVVPQFTLIPVESTHGTLNVC